MNTYFNLLSKFFLTTIMLPLLLCLTAIAYGQNVNDITLKNYRPVSIYKIPKTKIEKAKYPVVDFHSHNYPKSESEVKEWIQTMDAAGIAKTIILSYSTGAGFDSVIERYAPYKDRFEVWCGFDYTGYDKPGWQQYAIAELERCYKKGATGVGELGDKGLGEFYSLPTPGYGIHIDDPRMQPLLKRCGELHLPVSIHVAEDEWMYQKPDSTNDGLMNAATWHVDMNKPNKLGHDALQKSLENAVRENPKTIFVACHLLNACSNLQQLGDLLDKYPNLYADIAARFGEFAPVPRYAATFFTKYQDRLVYGTDNNPEEHMYLTTFRILETADEHFYEPETFNYHWALYGLNLPKEVLDKLYHKNAEKILK